MEKNLLPLEKELEIMHSTKLAMGFDPGKDSLEEWQQKARRKLTELIGLSKDNCELKFRIESRTENENFIETRFMFNSEEDYSVPCHFLEPKKKLCNKPPVMICLQGHSTGMHISLGRAKYEGDEKDITGGDRDFAIQAVQHGICAVTLEQRCFGEKGGTPKTNCYTASMAALLCGRTIIGGRVLDIMRLIDVLEKYFSDVCDTDFIICGGNSGGGTATFYAAAADERIKLAVPSCSLCTFEASIGSINHCACNYVPGIRKYFDMAELGGLIAPRPLIAVSGKLDNIFPLKEAREEFARIKNIYYKNSSAPDNCVHIIGDEGHRFYAEPAWKEIMKFISEE